MFGLAKKQEPTELETREELLAKFKAAVDECNRLWLAMPRSHNLWIDWHEKQLLIVKTTKTKRLFTRETIWPPETIEGVITKEEEGYGT